MPVTSLSSPLRVWLIYTNKDQSFCDELSHHLALLQNEGIIQYSHGLVIELGKNWQEESERQAAAADIVILLISADFLAANSMQRPDMQHIFSRQALGQLIVLPVILRPVEWQATALSRLDPLPPGGRPIVDWPTHDHGWKEVTRQLRALGRERPRGLLRVLLCVAGEEPAAYEQALRTALLSLGSIQIDLFDRAAFGSEQARVDACRTALRNAEIVVIVQEDSPALNTESSHLQFVRHVYREIESDGKPALVFLRQWEERNQIPGQSSAQHGEIISLRRELLRNRVVDFFESAKELPRRIERALANFSFQRRALGGSCPRPLPPQPLIAHPYPLDAHFIGRSEERRLLADWFNGDAAPLLVLEAMGGQGKTALAWCFSQFDVLGAPLPGAGSPPLHRRFRPERPCQGFLWWSFYEVNARFPEFLKAALRYFRGTTDSESSPAPLGHKDDPVRELLWHLERQRFFLVLDGFERELKSYIAGYRPDHGDMPVGGDPRDARRCIDHDAVRFLVGLCGIPQLRARVLLTSRLFPAELEAADGSPLSACRRVILRDFSDDEVVELFHHSGITAHAKDIAALAAIYGRHPLAMRLLIGVIRNDPMYPGDLRAADGYDVIRDLVRRQHHILHVAFESLARPDQQLLSSIAAFRGPVDYKAIVAVEDARAQAGGARGRDASTLRRAVRELTSRNLLLREERRRQFDLHPVVRRYAYERLVNKQSIHHDLSTYFESFATAGQAQDRSQLEPLIELFHQLVASGNHSRALQVLRQRIYAPLVHEFVDVRTALELFSALSPELKPQAYSWKAGDPRQWFNQRFAVVLFAAGLLRRALDFLDHKRRLSESSSDDSGMYNVDEILQSVLDDSMNQVAMLRVCGELQAAVRFCEEQRGLLFLSSEVSGSHELHPWDPIPWLLDAEHALTLICMGRSDEAERLLEALKLPALGSAREDAAARCSLARIHRLCAQAHGMNQRPARAVQAAHAGRELLLSMEPRSLARTQELLALDAVLARHIAHPALAAPKSLGDALSLWSERLADNLRMTRASGLAGYEIDTSLALAEVRLAVGDATAAISHATLAWSLAARGELRLYAADALLLLARIAAAQGLTQQRRDWALQAVQAAELGTGLDVYVPVAQAARALASETHGTTGSPRRSSS